MKKLLLSSTFLVIGATAAMAADMRLPVKAPVAVAPAPVLSWTGCYIGAHVGGTQIHSFAATNFEGTGSSGDNGTGAIAGGQAGCNYQQGNWVFGVEGEGAWSNARTTNAITLSPIDSMSVTTRNTSNIGIAGRAGVAFDRTLIYAKGGWAWGSFNFDSTLNCCFSAPAFASGSYDLSGYLVGAGIEHALTRNWTVKFEYNYLDFGSRLLIVGATPFIGTPITASTSPSVHVFKIGTNYLFDLGGAPLVAKY